MDQKKSISYINFQGILSACRKNLLFIALVLFVCILACFSYYKLTNVLQKTYSIEFNYTVLPNNANTEHDRLTNNDMTAASALAALYHNLYCDPLYTNQIIARVGVDGGVKSGNSSNIEIYSMKTGSLQTYKMHVSSNNATLTKKLFDAVVEDMQTSSGLPAGSSVIFNEDVSHLTVDSKVTSNRSLKRFLAVGFVLGLFLAVAFITLRSIRLCAVTEPTTLTMLSGLPVLAQEKVSIKKR